MSLPVKSQQELYDLFITTLQSFQAALTDLNPGSDIDTYAGVFSVAGNEFSRQIISQFSKCFFDLAQGPDENGGGPDDLQTLAVDHFGAAFARPGAVAAIDVATFSRAVNTAGAVTIPSGSIVKTTADALGNVQRYSTNATVTLTHGGGTDLSVSVAITAVVAGAAGSAAVGAINVIETSLLDSTIVVTNAGNATGEDAQDSPTYRETIRNLILALAGGSAAAVAAKAKTVSGVVTATPIEVEMPVIQYDIATDSTVGEFFRIPFPSLYIADATGTANSSLINAVKAAIALVRAFGVNINVQGATAVVVDWTASVVLNPSGPHYSVFSSDTTLIVDSMTAYINALPIGTGFVRATANAAILAIWGPAGTNDITAFTTSIPSGDVAATTTQKMEAGTVELS